MTADEVIQRIGILGYSKLKSTFTYDGHTLQLFVSNRQNYYHSLDRTYASSSFSNRYSYKGNNSNCVNSLEGQIKEYLRDTSWVSNPQWQCSQLSLARDISGLNLLIPNTYVIQAFLSAYPSAGADALSSGTFAWIINCDYTSVRYNYRWYNTSTGEYESYTDSYTDWTKYYFSRKYYQYYYIFQLDSNWATSSRSYPDTEGRILFCLDLDDPWISNQYHMMKFGDIKVYRTVDSNNTPVLMLD